MSYELYTDGSCNPNPGRGGWAYAIQVGGIMYEESGTVEGETTNNRAEFIALIEGLKATPRGAEVKVVTDSQQVILAVVGMKHPKKNKDLLAVIYELVSDRDVTTQRVKGHSGVEMNEHVDMMAQSKAGT